MGGAGALLAATSHRNLDDVSLSGPAPCDSMNVRICGCSPGCCVRRASGGADQRPMHSGSLGTVDSCQNAKQEFPFGLFMAEMM